VLTWAHWLELSRAPGTSWLRWYTKALAEAWTTRELAAELDSALEKAATTTADASDTTTASLAETLRAVQRYEGEVVGAFVALLERIERLPPRERPKEVPLMLAKGMDLLEAAHTKSGALLARVRRLAGEGDEAPSNTVGARSSAISSS